MNKLIEKYDDKKYTLKEYFPVILMFLFIFGFAIYTIIKKGDFKEVYLSTEFDGKVKDVYQEKGFIYLLISNEPNRFKIENSRNYDYSTFFLSDFLQQDDRVIKNRCSDTIFIERNSEEYHFLIGDRFYNNKEKSKKFIQKHNLRRPILNEMNNCN